MLSERCLSRHLSPTYLPPRFGPTSLPSQVRLYLYFTGRQEVIILGGVITDEVADVINRAKGTWPVKVYRNVRRDKTIGLGKNKQKLVQSFFRAGQLAGHNVIYDRHWTLTARLYYPVITLDRNTGRTK